MWDSIGINFHPLQRGRNADMFAASEKFSDEQKQIMQDWMNEIYEVFKGHVVKARGDRLAKPIDEIAGGRVYTGHQALELGLIDRLGSLADAVRFAADKANLPAGKYEVRVIPQPKNLAEMILADLTGTSDDDEQIQLSSLQTSHRPWKTFLDLAGKLEPHRAAVLQRTVAQLEILQREGATLATPEIVFD